MTIALQAYTAHERIAGSVSTDVRLVDLLAGSAPIVIENCLVAPLAGGPEGLERWAGVQVDDLLIVVAPGQSVVPVHAAWHPLTIDVGPYRVTGELPSMPGFDPARALARPTGSFILLGNVTVELLASAGFEQTDHAYALVNRYAVDSVESDLELGFFFPGAMVRAGKPVFSDEPEPNLDLEAEPEVAPVDSAGSFDGAFPDEPVYTARSA